MQDWLIWTIVGIIAFIILLTVGAFIGCFIFMKKAFGGRSVKYHGEVDPTKDIPLMGDNYVQLYHYGRKHAIEFAQMPREKVTVKTDDGLTLVGYYIKSPNPDVKHTLIAVHGFRGSPDSDFGSLCKFFIKNFNVLYINHRAHNESEGENIDFAQKAYLDMPKWIEKAQELNPDGDIVLHGVSMGGAIVCLASSLDLGNKVKFIVSDCAFSDGYEQLGHMVKFYKFPIFPFKLICGLSFRLITGVWSNKKKPIDSVKSSNYPILFVHGKSDRFVPAYMAKDLYDACSSEKDLLLVDGAGHGGSFFTGMNDYVQKYEDFINKYCSK